MVNFCSNTYKLLRYLLKLISTFVLQEFEFSTNFKEVLKSAEEWGRAQACIPKQMRTFNESIKSKKTVSSMIERKGDDKENKKNGELEPTQ